ncbi:MAG: S9 family peptidase [Bacteroidales bacterium]|nr:S9 family peptidase [Bacteroidales bacterium]
MKTLTLFAMIFLMTMHSASLHGQSAPMTPETLWQFGRLSDLQLSPDGSMLLYGVTFYDVKENKALRDLYVLPVTGGDPVNITNSDVSESSARWRPDGQRIGFLKTVDGKSQLFEMDPDGSNVTQLTNIGGGITGFGYAPDQQHIYYTKRVKVSPVLKDHHPDLEKARAYLADDLMYRHWDRWHDGTYSHIFFAAYSEGSVGEGTDIMKDEPWDSPLPPFGGSSQIAWTADGKSLAYTAKKMTGKAWTLSTNSDIYLYDIQTGTTRNLTPFNEGYDKNPVFSPDGRYMAWESMATPGFESDKNRIMIMDLESGKYRDYSAGFDQSSGGFAWSDDSRRLYFISGIHATYQLYYLDLETADIVQITEGHHNYQSILVYGDALYAERMSMSMPTEIYYVNASDGHGAQLSFVNREILNRTPMGRVEERWVKTTDNKDMLVWVIYPPDFDPAKKYPAILYCGGGPQSAVSQFFSYRWNFQIMAAHDYIVVAPNRRGLPTFGQEWNDQISLDYGGQNMKDYLSAIDAVKTEPFVDETRLGAVGASYGGYSVFWLAGNHDKRFSAFISHCGLFNLESWYATTEEMFFANHDIGGAFWEDPRPHSYDFSPHLHLHKWDTPIMVIHGAKDYRVPYGEGLQAFNAARLMDIPSRLLVFPEENHWVLSAQNGIVWQREFFRWLDQWLK